MNGLFAFIEGKEAETQAAKALVMPLLEALDPEGPWTCANLRALADQQPGHDPVIGRALEHLRRYALPILEREEALAAADFESFERQIGAFEEVFWRERFAQDGHAMTARDYLCGAHALAEAEVRGLARQGLLDVDAITAALGGGPDCPACKRGVQRVVLEELKRAKAARLLA